MNRFERNIGLLSQKQQDQLQSSHICVCGVGGMGGIAAEALVRMGVGKITLVDHDVYERSNLNRQVHCTELTLGQKKVDVVAEKLRAINPDLKITCFSGLSPENVRTIAHAPDMIVNGMDDVRASILLEREARKNRKTIVDAWVTPYASVFVMGPDSPHWESFLDFPTKNKSVEEITDADVVACLRQEIKFTLSHFEPQKIVDPKLIESIISGKIPRPSLVPVVWISGTLMANEVMKIITKQGELASHWGVFYNQYDHEIKVINEEGFVHEERRNFKTAV